MTKIAIGIIEHEASSSAGEHLRDHFDLVSLVNADPATGSPWRGFGANHNTLITQCTGADWYLALNPDVSITPVDVIELIERAEAAGLAIAAPLFRSPWGLTGRPQRNFPTPGYWLRSAVNRLPVAASSEPAAGSRWVSGACMAIDLRRAPDLHFDERYFMYFEDPDICLRALRSGRRVGVVQTVTVGHSTGWSPEDPLRWRRGVEFARSALIFAETAGCSPRAMRFAALCNFGSRMTTARTPQGRAGARAITRGFALAGRGVGLRELALAYNNGRI
jgi:GT2 family glycosyltransferase